MSEERNPQLLRLSLLLQLQQRARRAPKGELPFLMLNETHTLLPYQRAVLWQPAIAGGPKVLAVSGVESVDGQTPFGRWLALSLPRVEAADGQRGMQRLSGVEAGVEGWDQWLPPQVLAAPLVGAAGDVRAVLLFCRQEPWTDAELQLLEYLVDAYGHAYAYSLTPYRGIRPAGRRRAWMWGAAALAGVLCLLPVRQSVLAPAEVAPQDPTLVRAPLDGVVERFFVEPNQQVTAGQALFALDDTQLNSRLEVARKTRDIARAEYRQAAQQAFSDARAKATVAALGERVKRHAAEVEYYTRLLERIQVKAPQAGIVIFDDPDAWLGRPVRIGQRVLVIADPAVVELDISLAVADAMELEEGDEVVFYRNIAPLQPLKGRLHRIGYSAFVTPQQVMAYRLQAAFEAGQAPPRIGLRGTAKVYGERTPFVLLVLNRPLAAARRWAGL